MLDEKNIKRVAEAILGELESFDRTFKIRPPVPTGNFEIDTIQQTNYLAQQQLRNEPFIAYVKIQENNDEKTYFVCKRDIPLNYTPKTEKGCFVSYKAPMGRIVEMEVGEDDEIEIRQGYKNVLILEKNLFKPEKANGQKWDGINNRFSFLLKEYHYVESLIEFLKPYQNIKDRIAEEKKTIKDGQELQKLEKQLYKELEEQHKIEVGLKREVIQKIELREQPILDKNQGEIFRLPVSSRIILTGSPGTGKTTVLIKRIAQKCDPNFLAESEKAGLNDKQLLDFFNPKNWVMFTPTELLRSYLKEAFAKELLPASDATVKTWNNERIHIARDILGFLKTGNDGIFIKTDKNLIKAENNDDLTNYAKKFIIFYYRYIYKEFKNAYQILRSNQTTPKLRTKFSHIHEKINNAKSKVKTEDLIFYLIEELMRLRGLFDQKKRELDEIIEQAANEFINSGESVIEQVYNIYQRYQKVNAQEDEEEDKDLKEDHKIKDKRIIARRQIKRTLKWFAEKIVNNRTHINRNVHTDIIKIISVNRVYLLFENKNRLIQVGKKIIDLKVTNILTQGYTNLLNRIPLYYQKFRLEQLKQPSSVIKKECEAEIRDKKLCGHEIDLLIFVMLKNVRRILQKNSDRNWLTTDSRIDLIEGVKTLYKTQVSVDETTDFSSIQIGCMFHLSHPQYTSVTLSGDLMQRVTPFGLQNWNECAFFSKQFDHYQVTKVYRQSPKLLKIAEELYKKNVGENPPFNSVYKNNVNDPDPLKFESKKDNTILGQWITERIVEIYKLNNKKLPSIAVFVGEDKQIDHIKKILESPLRNNSFDIEPCPGGRILSTQSKIRIFSVKYIKGLEFESVFFVNIDKIADQQPELFEKYLYVGLTRAASFLAVTYDTEFPHKIEFVESYFKKRTWKY